MQADVIVLGAGIVGVSAALDLQARGRDVVLVDKHDRAGAETSFGNAGLIERASMFPYMFPREWAALRRYAFNRAPDVHYQLSALPSVAAWLWRYYLNSSPKAAERIAAAARPLIERSLVEHEVWAELAGVAGALRRTGWIKLYRSARAYDKGTWEARRLLSFGLDVDFLDKTALAKREPALRGEFAGAIHFLNPASVADPGGLVVAYADLFRRRGGRQVVGDARSISSSNRSWTVTTQNGPLAAREAVVALGPWSDDVFRPLGYRIPLAVKRGYHVHFEPASHLVLQHPTLDVEGGYLVTPMRAGIRMTTGAEFARRDAPPTPVQVNRAEPLARALLPLGPRVEAAPWMGARPCLPDMLPVIGPAPRHPGLWFDFGHQHHGLTLGPVSGRLLGELMTGTQPFTDPAPYRADRF
jgi:D-amino-acid dehydrogenase